MGVVTTVLGDIDGGELGHCQPHEHLYINAAAALRTHPELCLTNFDAALVELDLYRRAGGRAVVDAQPLGAGRDAFMLREASRLSGVTVVASTGYHVPFFYPSDHWIFTAPEEKLVDLFVSELREGMFLGGGYDWPDVRTAIRAGVVKAMLTARGVGGRDELLLRVAGRVAVEAGVSILLHTESGIGAVDAVRLLTDMGLAADRIMVCHLDRQAVDHRIHEEVADAGAFLEYDTVTLLEHHNNAEEILLLDHMANRGHLGQILLATDPTVDRLKGYGAKVGMDYLLTDFVPLLKAFGFTDGMLRAIFVDNPVRALARRP